jgi:ABC-type transport system involved in multi-copper enzyme maturation permease subunit
MNSHIGGEAWPVVQRELREAARWRWGGWLRLAGALGGVFVFWSVSSNDLASGWSLNLFDRVHALLLCLICVVVPALTADSIARERREGTLGLLFLTQLTAWGIVLGKTLAQSLRVLILCMAVVPVLSISFFLGGVTWDDLMRWVVLEIIAGMLCVAAGVVASSLARSRVTAFALTVLFLPFLVLVVFRGLVVQLWIQTLFDAITDMGVVFTATTPKVGIKDLASWPCFVIAAMILLAALRVAGFCVNRSWRDKVPSVRRQNWVKRYCTPVLKRWFAGRMRRSLEWNPIAWLQQYSWKARLSKWGLCLFFVILECFAMDGKYPYYLNTLLTVLLLILAAAYTFAGVNGFFQEKKSGALELILITPLSVDRIIFGRIWGMWQQFLPATLLLAGSDVAAHELIPVAYGFWRDTQPGFWTKDLEIVTQFVTLPAVATCIALSAKNLFLASALTVFMVFVPDVIWLVIIQKNAKTWPSAEQLYSDEVSLALFAVVIHAWMAMFAYSYLRRKLDSRSYTFT